MSLEFHQSLNHMVRKEDTSAGSEVLGDASFRQDPLLAARHCGNSSQRPHFLSSHS